MRPAQRQRAGADQPTMAAPPDTAGLRSATDGGMDPGERRLVAAVTNPAAEPGRDRYQQYRKHVAASLEASPWARVIKASDFTDNGVGLIHSTGPPLGRLARKYAPLVPV